MADKAGIMTEMKTAVESLARVFEAFSDDADDEWSTKFQEFCSTSLTQFKSRLDRCQNEADRRQEMFRSRSQLFKIVEDRLDERVKEIDPGLAKAIQTLTAAKRELFDDVLTTVVVERKPSMNVSNDLAEAATLKDASPRGIDSEDPITPQVRRSNNPSGIAAFAAAAKQRNQPIPIQASLTPGSGDSIDGETTLRPMTPSSASPLGRGDAYEETEDTVSPISPGAASTMSKSLGNSYSQIHMSRRERTAHAGASRPGKDLTLKQLRDIMQAIYASKAAHDQRCQETKEPTETMEQHTYSFLGKRYGLKSVIQEWASAIFRAIQRFAPKECDVAVFGKILQNTLAESFPAVQDTIRITVQQLLRQQLEARHPQRPPQELDNLWRARSRSGVPLSECEEVIRYMYNDNDSQAVLTRLQYASESSSQDGDPLPPGSVRYKDLMQVLLSFQMNLTEAFLADFCEIFKKVDSNSDGIVDTAQLEELVRRVGHVDGIEANSPASTVLMDAKAATANSIRKFKRATFSQCVDLFTGLISARWAATEEL